jgi:hypothetical protein
VPLPLKCGATVVDVVVAPEPPLCEAALPEPEDVFPLPLASALLPPNASDTITAAAAIQGFIKTTSPMKPFYGVLVALSYLDLKPAIS